MNKLAFVVVSVVATMAVACSSGDSEEVGSTNEDLDVSSCIQKATAPYGSSAWVDQVRACLREQAGGGYGGGSTTPPPPPPSTSGGSSSGGVSISVVCYNGTCHCGSGPKSGTVCDGAATTGATSCNVVCRY